MMKRKNFTLIEILGVCALIAILGIIGFGSYTFAMNKSKDSATRALMKQIEAGLAGIKNECGYYPNTKGIYQAIVFYNSDEATDVNQLSGKIKRFVSHDHNGNPPPFQDLGDKKVILETSVRLAFNKATDAETIAKYIEPVSYDNENYYLLKDAFGNVIYYKFPGTINKTGYDLISAGPDGTFSKDGKIDPSTSSSSEDYYKDGEAICDDITNF